MFGDNDMTIIEKVPNCDIPESDLEVEKERNKNYNFIQFYRHNMTAYRKLMLKNPTAASIFFFLSEHMTTQNAVSCSSRVLEEETKKSRTTVWKSVKYLEENGYLMVLKSGHTNVYVLNPNVVWAAGKTGKPYCTFEGPILLAKSENEDLEKKIEKFKVNQLDHKNG